MYFKSLKMIYLIQHCDDKYEGESVKDFNIKIKNKDIKTFEEIKKKSIFKFTVIKNKQRILYSTHYFEEDFLSINEAFNVGHIDVIKYLYENNCLGIDSLSASIRVAMIEEHIEILDYFKNFIKHFYKIYNLNSLKVYNWLLENNISINAKILRFSNITNPQLFKILMLKYPKIMVLKLNKKNKKLTSSMFKSKNRYIKGYNKN